MRLCTNLNGFQSFLLTALEGRSHPGMLLLLCINLCFHVWADSKGSTVKGSDANVCVTAVVCAYAGKGWKWKGVLCVCVCARVARLDLYTICVFRFRFWRCLPFSSGFAT